MKQKTFKQLYIRGWRELSDYTGFHWKTLQKWHLTIARLPFLKLDPSITRSRWIIPIDRVHAWLHGLGGGRHLLKK